MSRRKANSGSANKTNGAAGGRMLSSPDRIENVATSFSLMGGLRDITGTIESCQ